MDRYIKIKASGSGPHSIAFQCVSGSATAVQSPQNPGAKKDIILQFRGTINGARGSKNFSQQGSVHACGQHALRAEEGGDDCLWVLNKLEKHIVFWVWGLVEAPKEDCWGEGTKAYITSRVKKKTKKGGGRTKADIGRPYHEPREKAEMKGGKLGGKFFSNHRGDRPPHPERAGQCKCRPLHVQRKSEGATGGTRE